MRYVIFITLIINPQIMATIPNRKVVSFVRKSANRFTRMLNMYRDGLNTLCRNDPTAADEAAHGLKIIQTCQNLLEEIGESILAGTFERHPNYLKVFMDKLQPVYDVFPEDKKRYEPMLDIEVLVNDLDEVLDYVKLCMLYPPSINEIED